jgi:Carboxypeptidase regulatory-like domain/TonB-dependent Receptor Plug Domain
MQFRYNGWIRTTITFAMLLGAATILPTSQPIAFGQSLTSGDISGHVTDPTGAAIPGATVTVKNLGTGATYTSTTNATGGYHTALLQPGSYSITVSGTGFETASTTTQVSGGAIANGDVKMTLGKSSQTVTVTEAEPLLNTENADITTTFNTEQIQRLPNPGNDLTFVAQTAPGSVMNTTTNSNGAFFGYGNFSSFGLPATSNTFTVNGMYENDPFLNLNNSGATNLLLGNNMISSVTVVSNAYGAQYGGLGGAQVNEITKSGTNQFHGNAAYWWNGRVMNANGYFNNQSGTPRPFDNVNQYAASVGGPIFKNKTFFFGDYEGLRVLIPVTNVVTAPAPNFVSCLTTGLPAAGTSTPCALQQGGQFPNGIPQVPASNIPITAQVLGAYQSAPGYDTAAISQSDPNVVTFNVNTGNFTHEWLFEGRIDQHFGEKDSLYGTYDMDRGLQASYTDPLNPLFNADSVQPQYSGQLGETHVFTPNITNQFTFALLWYSAIFTNQNLDASKALVPWTVSWIDGSFNLLGGLNYIWPQGRNVTNYQFIDDVSVIKGRHNIKFGYYFRRDDVTDYSPGVTTTPLALATEADFATGSFDLYEQQYPTRLTQPVALYNEAGYLQDEWKPVPNLTVTAAVRVEHNSNPVCQVNCFDSFGTDFSGVSSDPTTPYNSMIITGKHQAFRSFQGFSIQPRVGFAWSPMGDGSSTVIRGGFGMFTDVFPATIADNILNNAPTNVGFTLPGPAEGGPFISTNPADPTSGESITSTSNAGFQAGFASAASYSTLSNTIAGFSAPSFTNSYHKLDYPTYEEWNLEIERQFGRGTVVDVNYVGDRGYHEPDVNGGVNAYGAPAGFTGINGDAPPNPSFSTVNEVLSNAVSNYNGITASVIHRSKSLLLQANYTWSHAMDEISNGGILGFNAGQSQIEPTDPQNLAFNYGNADYDVRQNFTASYVYSLPYWRGPHVITDGWQFTGTVFHHTGFPFTVTDSSVTNVIANYPSTFTQIFAHQIQNVRSCGSSAIINVNTGVGANPCAIINPANYTTPTAFGQQERNQTIAPAYTDTDFAVLKSFGIPKLESAKFIVGAQFFNLFNHPNFASPSSDIGSNNSTAGFITATVNTPTSILGSGLGGDASPRLIQIKGSFEF